MKRLWWLLVTLLLLVCRVPSSGQSASRFSIGLSPASDVALSIFAPDDIKGFDKVLRVAPDVAALKDGFVVTNMGKRAIIGLATKWYITEPSGSVRIHTFQSHSFLSPGFEPLATSNERLIVLPGMFIQEQMLSGSGVIVASPSRSTIALFGAANTLKVEIDSIIFDDGEIVGPNSLHLNAEIQLAKDATDIVMRHVHAAAAVYLKKSGESQFTSPNDKQVKEYLRRIDGGLPPSHVIRDALTTLSVPEAPGPTAARVARLSGTLLRTQHFAAVLEYMQSIPAPPVFYRKDGQPL